MSIKKIALTQGKFAIIDAQDFELVSKFKWHYRPSGRTKGKNGYAQIRGVSFQKRKNGKQWQVSTTIDGKQFYGGIFKTEKEAAVAYNKIAKKHFGNSAQLNKI